MDDVNSPTVFRLSFRSTTNLDWPALAPNTFFDALEDGSDYIGSGNIQINCSWPSLASAATENPVAVALAYKKIVYDIMTILVGVRPANTSGNGNRNVKTFYKDWCTKGVIVGTGLAFIGVTETTARGSLHFHVGKWPASLFGNCGLLKFSHVSVLVSLRTYDSNLGWAFPRAFRGYINNPRTLC